MTQHRNLGAIDVRAGTVTVTVGNLTIALVVASILYTFCLILACRKLTGLHRIRPQLSTKKLLLLSVATVCAVRIMTILGVAAMNIANVRAHYSLQPIIPYHHHSSSSSSGMDKNQAFYDKSMTVLFDLPNCVVVSTYVLLTLVWAECFLESRFHTESIISWRRLWLNLYMYFNSVMYAWQLLLYISIFLARDRIVRTVLYAGITGINFVAVLMVLSLFLYLNFRFSGFPFRSVDQRQSLHKISRVMALWSITRILWGVATLIVFLFNIELLQDSNTPFWSFVVLLLLFFVCEIVPIIAMLDYSYMNMISHTMGWYPDHVGDHIILTSPLIDISNNNAQEAAATSPIQDDLEEANETILAEEHLTPPRSQVPRT